MDGRKRCPGFAQFALRMGIVTLEDLQAALSTRKRTGETIERILLRMRLLTPQLAEHVHDALRLTRAG